MKPIPLSLFILFFSTAVFGAERTVSIFTDHESQEGTLRRILLIACDDAGPDTIRFANTSLSQIRMVLESPLVIPEDCRGEITLEGSSEADTILDARNLSRGGAEPGDSCIVHVYSDGHILRNLSFVNNSRGAGVCLFGRGNLLEENRLGTTAEGSEEPNRYGVVISNIFSEEYAGMDGSGSEVRGNHIGPNDSQGVWVEASDVMVGGESFEDDANIIQNNGEGGVYVMGENRSVHITHNSISNNGAASLGVDLNGDGVSLNDLTDKDKGPNEHLNFLDHFQAFPLVAASSGEERYWGWGVALKGVALEFYKVSEEDWSSEIFYGGGETFLADLLIEESSFEVHPDTVKLKSGDVVTSLVFDDEKNTSEFSMNVAVGADADLDGIIDAYETGNGLLLADSDGDGLPDSAEDKNRNGFHDPEFGETAATNADTDFDGLSDYYEIHGDGVYDPGVDSNPLVADTDGDGLRDGQEDTNGNGIWDNYLRETSPLFADSDDDGVADPLDNCPSLYNPEQEDWYCQL